MSRSLLHDWEGLIEKNKNNTEELFKIAEDIYNTAYIRGKASIERPQGEWVRLSSRLYKCKNCGFIADFKYPFCHCGADMRKGSEGNDY